MMQEDLTNKLLPLLAPTLDIGFNVFDVMHHGTHEKQLSNVFRWLLEIGGTHNFDSSGQQVFLDLVNRASGSAPALPPGPYSVRQEVNTSEPGASEDISDLVLESDDAVIVVENYETSDGHGHSFHGYHKFSERGGKRGLVVLLCADADQALLSDGWESAIVVTYEEFLNQLVLELDRNPDYARRNPDQYAFIMQMHRKYGNRKGRMSDKSVLEFVSVMCASGEAGRYGEQDRNIAAERFAADLAQQARDRFGESREVLQRVKGRLRQFGEAILRRQLNTTLGYEYVQRVTANYRGIYQWTITFDTHADVGSNSNDQFQIKFGPSAWFANEQDSYWTIKVAPEVVDYSRLFLTLSSGRELRQSEVTLHEILDGLDADDRRLHDEIIRLVNH